MKVKAAIIECSTCEKPAVLRLCFRFGGGGSEWLYQRDCKHKGALVVRGGEDSPEWAALVSLGPVDEAVASHETPKGTQ